MTKREIVNETNKYKVQLNECSIQASQCESALNSFKTFKKYFQAKTKKSHELQKNFLFSTIVLATITILISFISFPIAIVLLFSSAICFERFIFFKKANHKFKHCYDFFQELIKRLSNKHNDFTTQKEKILEHILELEHTIPETIIESISLIDEKKFNELTQVNEKTEVCSF